MNNSSPSRPGRITLVGGAHVDRTGWLSATSAMGCSNPGRFDERPGGAAFNVASVLAALGKTPEVLSHAGDDSAARWLRECAENRNVQFHASVEMGAGTGTYTSIIEPDGSLLIAVADMGIYDSFRSEPFLQRLEDLTSSDWLGVDANLPSIEIEELLSRTNARTVGFTVSKAKAAKLRPLADAFDLFFTNRTEACALVGADTVGDSTAAARLLSGHGIAQAVVSDGDKDITVLKDGAITTLPVPTLDVVVDVTGAGDALAGGTLFALMDGATLVEAVEFGIRAAQKTVEVEGPWRADLAEQLGVPHQS